MTLLRLLLMVVVVSFVGTASAATLWQVDDSGGYDFLTIQEAVNAASSGDTIKVWHGTYSEFVTVPTSSLTIYGVSSYAVIVNGAPGSSGSPIISVTGDWVNISSMGVQSSDYGPAVQLSNANHCDIYNLRFSTSRYGIVLSSADHNTVRSCAWTGTSGWYGIHLTSGSLNNLIKYNTMSSCTPYGIYVEASNDNTIYDNICNSNSDHGIYVLTSDNTTVEDNDARSNDDQGINLIDSHECTIHHNYLQGNYIGCYVYDAHNITFSDNWVWDNTNHGVYIDNDAYNLTFTTLYMYSNGGHGLYISTNCDSNSFTGGYVRDNGLDGIEVGYDCDDNTFDNLDVYGNLGDGIDVNWRSNDTIFTDIDTYNNGGNGIVIGRYLAAASLTNITAYNNTGEGVKVYDYAIDTIFTNITSRDNSGSGVMCTTTALTVSG
jgi:parallel beta-helix repeat protein